MLQERLHKEAREKFGCYAKRHTGKHLPAGEYCGAGAWNTVIPRNRAVCFKSEQREWQARVGERSVPSIRPGAQSSRRYAKQLRKNLREMRLIVEAASVGDIC